MEKSWRGDSGQLSEVVKSKTAAARRAIHFLSRIHGKCPVCGGAKPAIRSRAWRCENVQCPRRTTRRVEFSRPRGAPSTSKVGPRPHVWRTNGRARACTEPLRSVELKTAQRRHPNLNLGTGRKLPMQALARRRTLDAQSGPRVERAKLLPTFARCRLLSLSHRLENDCTAALDPFHDASRGVAALQLAKPTRRWITTKKREHKIGRADEEKSRIGLS